MERFLEIPCNPSSLSPLPLAFIGDGVFELFVREALVCRGNCPVKKLHNQAVEKVCCSAQAKAAERLQPILTEKEKEVFLRGRNAHVGHVPKNASPADYHGATGLETLFGYLYLEGNIERLRELIVFLTDSDSEKTLAVKTPLEKNFRGIRLETDRLLLREHVAEDLPDYHTLLSDCRAMRYLPKMQTNDLKKAEKNLRKAIEQAKSSRRELYFLCMEEKSSGKYIGEIGYTVLEKTPLGKLVDMGCFMHTAFWGHGYASEAFFEMVRFAFEEDNVYRISCGCLKENTASERLMQKCGFIKEGEYKESQWHEGRLKDRLAYALLRSNWGRKK